MTVVIYNLVLLYSTFFVWLSDVSKSRWVRFFFLFVAFLVIFIPAAIRFEVGTDFVSYINIYENLEKHEYIDPGYYYLNLFLKNIGANSQWIMVLSAFIVSLLMVFSYPRKSGVVFHVALFSLIYFFSFNGIRQAIAVLFVLVAFNLFLDSKKFFIPFLMVVLGSFFHESVLLILPLFVISGFFVGFLKSRYFFGFSVLIYFIFELYVTDILYVVEVMLRSYGSVYAEYFQSHHFSKTELGTGLGVAVKLIFSFYFIFNLKKLVPDNEGYAYLGAFTLFYILSIVLAKHINIFARLEHVFLFVPVCNVYALWIAKEIKYSKLASLVFISFLLLSFQMAALSTPTQYSDPMLNPYKTIFNRDG